MRHNQCTSTHVLRNVNVEVAEALFQLALIQTAVLLTGVVQLAEVATQVGPDRHTASTMLQLRVNDV